MYKINILNILIKEYKIWTIKLNSSTKKIENTILQTDMTNALEEKIISIGLSSILVYVGTSVLGFFSIVIGGFFSIIIFIIGWIISNQINKKIFGTVRKKEDLEPYELDLINNLNKVYKTHIRIRDNINQNKVLVNFKDYTILKIQFHNTIKNLNTFDTSKLAIKYKTKFFLIAKSYQNDISKFHEIYAHKG